LRLSLDTRRVGDVTIVRCNGRIVAGGESESLRAHVTWLLRDRRAIVLHLGEVEFIDSSGLGTIVRTLTSTRQARGELKLCNVPEQKAVAAFYRPGAGAETPVRTGRSVLCLDCNADVLAYLREVMCRAGYDVHTSGRLGDALILMRVTHFDLLLVGPGMTASPGTQQAFEAACAKFPVIELGSEFSTHDAGEAGAGLLEKIEARLNSKTA